MHKSTEIMIKMLNFRSFINIYYYLFSTYLLPLNLVSFIVFFCLWLIWVKMIKVRLWFHRKVVSTYYLQLFSLHHSWTSALQLGLFVSMIMGSRTFYVFKKLIKNWKNVRNSLKVIKPYKNLKHFWKRLMKAIFFS